MKLTRWERQRAIANEVKIQDSIEAWFASVDTFNAAYPDEPKIDDPQLRRELVDSKYRHLQLNLGFSDIVKYAPTGKRAGCDHLEPSHN